MSIDGATNSVGPESIKIWLTFNLLPHNYTVVDIYVDTLGTCLESGPT